MTPSPDVNNTKDESERIQAAIAPHQKLPMEILSRIFALCGSKTRYLPADLKPRSAPWALRQVCSTWRQLVLSPNSLWNNVCIWTHSSPDDEEEDYKYKSWGSKLQMARELLPQTGLVSITLLSEYRKKSFATQDIESALHGLVDLYADRLQELGITCPFYGYVAILEADPRLFRRVETLVLIVSGYHQGDPQYETGRYHINNGIFRNASRLRELGVAGDGDFLDSIRFQSIPWAQLTDLTFEFRQDEESSPPSRSTGPTWNGFLPVLSQCNNLTACQLKLRALGTVSNIHITLPYLRSLTLNLRETNPLASLTLPSLERLHLVQKHLSPLDIASLIERSGCTLRVLIDEQNYEDAEAVELSAADYDYLLRRLEHLQELCTITVFEPSDIIQIAQGTRLPQLESLQFASYLPEMVPDAVEHGLNLAPQVAGSTRKLRNIICEYANLDKILLSRNPKNIAAESDNKELSNKYGVSLQFSPSFRVCLSARVKK